MVEWAPGRWPCAGKRTMDDGGCGAPRNGHCRDVHSITLHTTVGHWRGTPYGGFGRLWASETGIRVFRAGLGPRNGHMGGSRALLAGSGMEGASGAPRNRQHECTWTAVLCRTPVFKIWSHKALRGRLFS